jgi:hypothetical protein
MLSFMLDPKFKSFHSMSSFIGHEQRFLYPMLLKCYHHLHLMIKSKSEFADQTMDAYYSLDIFAMVAWTSESTKKIVKRELLILRHYQVDIKEITCIFRWWEKHEVIFPTIRFLAQQILGIVSSQIEIKMVKTHLKES